MHGTIVTKINDYNVITFVKIVDNEKICTRIK